jgi:superkiller protein 3
MSALVKTKLKAARDAIGKKDWAAAQIAASTALEYEPDNYNACARRAIFSPHLGLKNGDRNVFLGLASLELGQLEQSEQVIFLDAVPAKADRWVSPGVPQGHRGRP